MSAAPHSAPPSGDKAGPDPDRAPTPGRIKRQVQAREHRFAIVCPPGLEDICLAEARALGLALCNAADGSPPEPAAVLEWTGRLEDLYKACLFLRCASRVLVRLDRFRAGAREELFRQAAAFPWELWLPGGGELRVDAHVRQSRISHEGMTADTVFAAVSRRLEQAGLAAPRRAGARPVGPEDGEDAEQEPASPAGADVAVYAPEPSRQRLIVLLEDNHAIISLDASGEHLHRRGWRLVQGAAPIRENLAAGLLAWAGWPVRHASLVDGMCGSGTFAIEALGLARGCPASGAASRDFAFRHWPSFQPARLAWLGRQSFPGAGLSAVPAILANELDPAVLGLASRNGERFCGPSSPPQVAVPPAAAAEDACRITWRGGDFFALEPPLPPGLLVLNPPYGLRLSDGAGSLYPRLCRHLAAAWADWEILLLGLPETALGPLAPRLADQRSFRHGGLRLVAWHFRQS